MRPVFPHNVLWFGSRLNKQIEMIHKLKFLFGLFLEILSFLDQLKVFDISYFGNGLGFAEIERAADDIVNRMLQGSLKLPIGIQSASLSFHRPKNNKSSVYFTTRL